MAECQLPKLNTRVRFPSPAPHKNPPKALYFKGFRRVSFMVICNQFPGGNGGGSFQHFTAIQALAGQGPPALRNIPARLFWLILKEQKDAVDRNAPPALPADGEVHAVQ